MPAPRATTLDEEDSLANDLARVLDGDESNEDVFGLGCSLNEDDASSFGGPRSMSVGPMVAGVSPQSSRVAPTTDEAKGGSAFKRRFNQAFSSTDAIDLDSD